MVWRWLEFPDRNVSHLPPLVLAAHGGMAIQNPSLALSAPFTLHPHHTPPPSLPIPSKVIFHDVMSKLKSMMGSLNTQGDVDRLLDKLDEFRYADHFGIQVVHA